MFKLGRDLSGRGCNHLRIAANPPWFTNASANRVFCKLSTTFFRLATLFVAGCLFLFASSSLMK